MTTLLIARFQTNDKPWSDPVLQQTWEHEWGKRLRPFLGPFHQREQGDLFGPYRKRADAVHRVTVKMDGQDKPATFYVENKAHKGVRAHMMFATPEEAFGKVYHTVGPCKDDYPNMHIDHNMAGQIVKMQEPAMLAYHMAEEINGAAIRITGEGWRSCSQQSILHNSPPPGRFADPDVSRHPRGLAIDVYNTPDNLTPKAKAALEAVGFCQGVPGEPWHFAFTECG